MYRKEIIYIIQYSNFNCFKKWRDQMLYAQSLDKMFAENWTKYLVYIRKLSKSLFKVYDFRAQFSAIVLNCEYIKKKYWLFLCAERKKQYLYAPNTHNNGKKLWRECYNDFINQFSLIVNMVCWKYSYSFALYIT